MYDAVLVFGDVWQAQDRCGRWPLERRTSGEGRCRPRSTVSPQRGKWRHLQAKGTEPQEGREATRRQLYSSWGLASEKEQGAGSKREQHVWRSGVERLRLRWANYGKSSIGRGRWLEEGVKFVTLVYNTPLLLLFYTSFYTMLCKRIYSLHLPQSSFAVVLKV